MSTLRKNDDSYILRLVVRLTLMSKCDRHASKERQISVFRHWCLSQFATLRPRIRIPVLRDHEVGVPISRSLIIAIEYSVNDASFVGSDGRRVSGEETEKKDEDGGSGSA